MCCRVASSANAAERLPRSITITSSNAQSGDNLLAGAEGRNLCSHPQSFKMIPALPPAALARAAFMLQLSTMTMTASVQYDSCGHASGRECDEPRYCRPAHASKRTLPSAPTPHHATLFD